MAKKEKKEKKLKKSKVEIQEAVNEQATVETIDDFAAQIEQELEKQEQESKYVEKVIVQDGKTFIDITANYVSEPEETTVQEPVDTQVVHQKKKVRTFNEIFGSFFKGFIRVFYKVVIFVYNFFHIIIAIFNFRNESIISVFFV